MIRGSWLAGGRVDPYLQLTLEEPCDLDDPAQDYSGGSSKDIRLRGELMVR